MSDRDGFAGGLGRLTDGRIHSNADGSLFDAVTGEAVAPLGAPAAKDADKPTFTAEDLAHIEAEPDAPGADLTAEEVAELKDLLARKIYSPEELQRHRGLTDAELASLTAKPVSKVSLQQELAALRALKSTDAKAYWSEETQARELDLIRSIEKGKAEKVEAKAEAEKTETKAEAEAAEPDGLAEIEAELAKIAALRKSDRRAYDKDEAMQARELELIEARERTKEGLRLHEAGTAVVAAVLEAVPDAATFDASFMSVADAMSAESQDALRMGLATPVESMVIRPATDEQITGFAALDPEAAALVKSWGSRGAQRLGQVHARIDAAMAGLDDADFARAGAWIDSLDPQQRVGIARALAGK